MGFSFQFSFEKKSKQFSTKTSKIYCQDSVLMLTKIAPKWSEVCQSSHGIKCEWRPWNLVHHNFEKKSIILKILNTQKAFQLISQLIKMYFFLFMLVHVLGSHDGWLSPKCVGVLNALVAWYYLQLSLSQFNSLPTLSIIDFQAYAALLSFFPWILYYLGCNPFGMGDIFMLTSFIAMLKTCLPQI